MTSYVRVLLAGRFREIVGQRELLKDVGSGMTLQGLLATLAETYGRDFNEVIDSETGEISLEAWVMVNGKSARSTDVKLKDNDVVIITIPVGGGAGVRVGIHEKGEISLIDLIRDVQSRSDVYKAGALGCFVGIVRGVAKDGGEVKKLRFEADKEAASRNLSKIASDILGRPGIVDIRIHHNIGELRVGDDIVYIVVAGRHREDVFQALEDAIERLKRETTIWKKEYSTLGEYWVSVADKSDKNENSDESS